MSQKPKQFSPQRGGANKKFNFRQDIDNLYNSKWEKYRYRYLHHNPTCYACGGKSEVVDHIKAHRGDEDLFWDEMNYIPLCHRCHNTVTGLFDKPGKPLKDKLQWLAWSRARNEISTKAKVVPIEGD
jgi:5-methylcytosine-specific restriction endonuclease McrA